MESCSDIHDSSLQTEESFEFRSKEDEGIDDSFKLMALLKEFQLGDIYPVLFASGVTFLSLEYLDRDDIKDAIPNIGQRAMFREKLFAWRKQKAFIKESFSNTKNSSHTKNKDEKRRLQNTHSRVNNQCVQTTQSAQPTQTVQNTQADQNPQNDEICVWVPTQTEYSHALSPSLSAVNSLILKRDGPLQQISTLLNLTEIGKDVTKFYKKWNKLLNYHRHDIINIIIEEIMKKNIQLKIQDFVNILQQIVDLFPSEKDNTDYYYIPRNGKKNPSGKLYSKYHNTRTKKRKLSMANTSRSMCDENISKRPSHSCKLDYTLRDDLKEELKEQTLEWNEICDLWEATFLSRQNDRTKYSDKKFLAEWPLLRDFRAVNLINFDFQMMFPNRGNLLREKWEMFKTGISRFFRANIKTAKSKELLLKAETTNDIRCADCILTILLNMVLPTPERYKPTNGTKKKKPTIEDISEGFVLEITSISEYKNKLEQKTDELDNQILQPFILVDGGLDNIKSFYVYLDKTFFKFHTFIDALDMCFKLYNILALTYPKICEYMWLFIQKYLYEIDIKNDKRIPHLTSLLNFMKHNV